MPMLEFGFPVGYMGNQPPDTKATNHSSATNFPQHVDKFTQTPSVGPFSPRDASDVSGSGKGTPRSQGCTRHLSSSLPQHAFNSSSSFHRTDAAPSGTTAAAAEISTRQKTTRGHTSHKEELHRLHKNFPPIHVRT